MFCRKKKYTLPEESRKEEITRTKKCLNCVNGGVFSISVEKEKDLTYFLETAMTAVSIHRNRYILLLNAREGSKMTSKVTKHVTEFWQWH